MPRCPTTKLQDILDRTLKLSRIESPGIARILDVANTGSGGLVVSEWIRGGSLQEVAETSPSPIGGARAMQIAGRRRRGRPIGPGSRCRSTTPAGSG